MAELCLATIRDANSACQPPNFQTAERRQYKQMQDLLKDVALSVRYSLALLINLPALEASCIPKDKPAFERLRQERERLYEAIQAYIKWIYEPTIGLAKTWNETAQPGEKDVQNKLKCLKEHVVRLRNELNLRIELRESHGSETYYESQDMGNMPSRSPWLNGGIPRMTFLTVHGLGEHSTVVLGFSATAWTDSALHAWATKCRDQDLAKYEHSPTIERSKNAVSVLKKVQSQVGNKGWTASVITDPIIDFRKRSTRKPFSQGPYGMALEFPKLESRARCPACLCSTEIRVTAEDGLEIVDMIDGGKFWGLSCAEVEAMIVIEQLEQKPVNHLTRMVLAMKGLFSISKI
ncbi:MAG: hypothetical protein Q9213_002395 [Squamulea squamosa]